MKTQVSAQAGGTEVEVEICGQEKSSFMKGHEEVLGKRDDGEKRMVMNGNNRIVSHHLYTKTKELEQTTCAGPHPDFPHSKGSQTFLGGGPSGPKKAGCGMERAVYLPNPPDLLCIT